MPETYDQIIEEIKANDYAADEYCEKYDCEQDEMTYFVGAALHLAARVREAVGGDPSEWWVECNGERLCVGDNVKVQYDNDVYTVIGFSHLYDDNPTVFLDCRSPAPAKDVHKVIPDTREKIIEDTLNKLNPIMMGQSDVLVESVEQAVDRAMELGAVDDA